MKNQQFQQSDLLFVTLTDAGNNEYIKTPVKGWIAVTEAAQDGSVLSCNFAPVGSRGYGHVVWPKFELHVLMRGKHGQTSPYAALKELEEIVNFTGDKEQYKLELPGSCLEFFAANDEDAKKEADKHLTDRSVKATGLKLFRYPKGWANKPSAGLIEVPFYRLK